MPVSRGRMRGIGSITIGTHIQINPGQEKGKHKSMGNMANLLWVLPEGKWTCKMWMCTRGGGKGVRWTRIWWMQEAPLSPPYTCGKWKTSWCESPEFHRTPSLPRRNHGHCQACLRAPRGVHASPEAQWGKLWNGTWNCTWQGGWRYYFKHTLAPNFQPFNQNYLGKVSNVAAYADLYPTSPVIPWISWTQVWSDTLGFHTCSHLALQWKLFLLSQKCWCL